MAAPWSAELYHNSRIFVKIVTPVSNLRLGSSDGSLRDSPEAPDGRAIPPTTFSQLIKLGSKPMRKTQVRIDNLFTVLPPDAWLQNLLRHNRCWGIWEQMLGRFAFLSPGKLSFFWATSSLCIYFNKTLEYQSHDKENGVQDFHQAIFNYL